MKRICMVLCAWGLFLLPIHAAAQDKLVVSVWGGSWRDMVANIIAKKFTAETGVQVEFITGGTIDRLNKEKLAKGNPESDITFTTSHVGWLYATDGLYETLDLGEGAERQEPGAAGQDQPLSHRHLGLCLHHRLPARPRQRHDVRKLGRPVEAGDEGQARLARLSIRAISSPSPPSCRARRRQLGKGTRQAQGSSSRASRRSTPTTPTASSSLPTARRRSRSSCR